MKATEQHFLVVLFIMLYKVVLTFGSVGEILKCNHSNESYWAVLSSRTVSYTVQGECNFETVKSWSVTVQTKAINQCFLVVSRLLRSKNIGANVLTLFFTYVMITHNKFIKCLLSARNSKPITKLSEKCRAKASLVKPKRLSCPQGKLFYFCIKENTWASNICFASSGS